MKVEIQKLVEKKLLGYRFTTNDLITFETDATRGLLIIDAVDNSLTIDLTPHTIEQLSEFIRYIKSDLDE
jgi:hypothetical protein